MRLTTKTSHPACFRCPQINISILELQWRPAVAADSPAHPCDMSNPAPGFRGEWTGRSCCRTPHKNCPEADFFADARRSSPTEPQNLYCAAYVELQMLSHARASPRIRPVSTQARQVHSLPVPQTKHGHGQRGARRWRARRRVWKRKENGLFAATDLDHKNAQLTLHEKNTKLWYFYILKRSQICKSRWKRVKVESINYFPKTFGVLKLILFFCRYIPMSTFLCLLKCICSFWIKLFFKQLYFMWRLHVEARKSSASNSSI